MLDSVLSPTVHAVIVVVLSKSRSIGPENPPEKLKNAKQILKRMRHICVEDFKLCDII